MPEEISQNQPYDWTRIIFLSEDFNPEQKAAIILVLDDMAKHPAGVKIFEEIEFSNKKVYLQKTEKDFFGNDQGSYCTQIQKDDEATIKAIEQFDKNATCERQDLNSLIELNEITHKISISFDQLKEVAFIDSASGLLSPLTLNYVLAHELSHVHFEPYELFLEFSKKVENSALDSLDISKEDAEDFAYFIFSKGVNKSIILLKNSLKNSQGLSEAEIELTQNVLGILEDYKEKIALYEAKYPNISKNDGLRFYMEEYADQNASKYCTKEPIRESYLANINLKEPLNDFVFYTNNEFELKKYSPILKERNGTEFATYSNFEYLLQDINNSPKNLLEQDFLNIATKLLELGLKHDCYDIRYSSINELGSLSPLEKVFFSNLQKSIKENLPSK